MTARLSWPLKTCKAQSDDPHWAEPWLEVAISHPHHPGFFRSLLSDSHTSSDMLIWVQQGRFIEAPTGKGSSNHPAFAGLPSLLRTELSPSYQDLTLALSQFLRHFVGKCCHVKNGREGRLSRHKQKAADVACGYPCSEDTLGRS